MFCNRISDREKTVYFVLLFFCICAGVLNMHWHFPRLAVSTAAATSSLADLALQKVLHDASPVFGQYSPSSAPKANWMKNYPDSTPIVHMNLPGTHDSATWNYSQATQDALRDVTELNGSPLYDSVVYRCQTLSFTDMLDRGIRVFDLRFALDPTNSSLVFYHGAALQSETATVENVLFVFYRWLTDHPAEALFLSFQHERPPFGALAQQKTYDLFTSAHAKKYILQTQNRLGTLGDARGKITLFRRFDLDALPDSYTEALPGIHFSPRKWTVNAPNIELVYNPTENSIAYIEDFYETSAGQGTSAALNIQWKYNATTAHLTKAATQAPDSLFWTFASSEYNANIPPDFPRIMALGNGTELTLKGGVNHQLASFLKQQRGKRMGIVMLDFFDEPDDLVDTILSL